MTHPQSDKVAPGAWRFTPRAFLAREWPYLLMLILALFGVAYTSFSKTPMTTYWIVLAPWVICVVTRWRDAENREQRMHLIRTQALHWGAVLLAMHLMFLADVTRMMNADASALAALTMLALGTFTWMAVSGIADLILARAREGSAGATVISLKNHWKRICEFD